MGRAVFQVENVEVLEDNHIKFDFLGKDSIRYENEVEVHPKVHKLVQHFRTCKEKTGKDRKGALRSLVAPNSPIFLCCPMHTMLEQIESLYQRQSMLRLGRQD